MVSYAVFHHSIFCGKVVLTGFPTITTIATIAIPFLLPEYSLYYTTCGFTSLKRHLQLPVDRLTNTIGGMQP